MNHTPYYNLNKPEGPEYYNVEDFNQNADIIDNALYEHVIDKGNPHSVTKAQIGLGNVNNTSDLQKPISLAVQDALNAKADKGSLVTGVKGNSESEYRIGQVNITKANIGLSNVQNVTTNGQTPTFTTATTLANIKSGETLTVMLGKIARAIADLISHLANTSNPHSVTKSQVGLGNVGNFKAVSTVAGQNLTETEKANARANIGAGSSTPDIIFVRSR